MPLFKDQNKSKKQATSVKINASTKKKALEIIILDESKSSDDFLDTDNSSREVKFDIDQNQTVEIDNMIKEFNDVMKETII